MAILEALEAPIPKTALKQMNQETVLSLALNPIIKAINEYLKKNWGQSARIVLSLEVDLDFIVITQCKFTNEMLNDNLIDSIISHYENLEDDDVWVVKRHTKKPHVLIFS